METYLNYQKIHRNLLKDLPGRTKDVIERRFGLEGDKRETLEAIGKNYGICRERIRQIEETGINIIRKEIKKPLYQRIFQRFTDQLKENGDLKREDLLLSQFSLQKLQNQAFFWLTLGDPFSRFSETKDFYPLWTINSDSLNLARKVVGNFINRFEAKKKLVSPEEIFGIFKKDLEPGIKLTSQALFSYLEVSRQIERSSDGLFGLKEWPEVSPRGIRDKAYLALKKNNSPLHFSEVAKSIDQLDLASKTLTLPQTVHNELIRDPRFVLVGRGIYALKEWGYVPGQVRDVISKILKESKKSLSKQEVVDKVLSQRIVKENTILLSLQDKKYFSKDPQGKYIVKKA